MEIMAVDDIFLRLRTAVAPYGKEMTIIMDSPVHYELQIPHAFVIGDNHYQGCYYCFVFNAHKTVFFSLSLMRIFPGMLAIPEQLRKNLRSQGRFGFKKLNEVQDAAISQLLRDAFDLYKSRITAS